MATLTLSKKTVIFPILMFGIFTLSYFYFLKYEPKIIQRIEDVKGATSSIQNAIPYPPDSTKVSESRTSNNIRQITFEATRNTQEVQGFYKAVYTNKGWNLSSKSITNGAISTRYKKDKTYILITTTQLAETGKTLVNVEKNF